MIRKTQLSQPYRSSGYCTFLLTVLVCFISNKVLVLTAEYYRPLPLYSHSVQELNTKAIWTPRFMSPAMLEDDSSTSSSARPENLMSAKFNFDIDQIMNDMIPPTRQSFLGKRDDTLFRAEQKDTWLSNVKIIPDEHHVSAFLNRGIVKRFLFLNAKQGNPLSITVTPCTSILLWNVKFWAVSDNGTFASADVLKTFRTQRTISFKESHGKRGVYGIEMRALYSDSYVHLYATSFNMDPLRITPSMANDPIDRSSYLPWSSVYDGLNLQSWSSTYRNRKLSSFQTGGVVADFHSNYISSSRPKISVKRLRGNRLHVKWDASPVNPHLMHYCIVVNTRRDYTSLCAASGERYGVLPPDLMHVVYYGSDSYFGEGGSFWNEPERYLMDQAAVPYSNNSFGMNSRGNMRSEHHRRRHDRSKIRRATSHTHKDIIIGCVGKKTNYILNNLRDGMLYYVNVFVRDMLTNISYPYVRTTMKYRIPKVSPNVLKDGKPSKIKLTPLPISDASTVTTRSMQRPTTLRFNLKKPCSELILYVMPCGGGTIHFEVLHGNSSLTTYKNVDSLEIVKILSPKRGKYFVKIYQNLEQASHREHARMVEVFVAKKNRRFPLPKLPVITRISEDESRRNCDSIEIQWWPSPDQRDNEYCIFLKEETRKKRVFQFKKPNQCDVERSLKSDPYVSLSLCLQRDRNSEGTMFSQRIVGLVPGKTYVVQLILKRHNGKALSYDLHHVKTLETCPEGVKK